MKNILNFLSFMLESSGIGDHFKLTARDKWSIDTTRHGQDRVYYRSNDADQSEIRNIRKSEWQEVILSQKEIIAKAYYELPLNSDKEQDKDPDEMHFRIGVETAERFGPIIEDMNLFIAVKPDFLTGSWKVTLKTFKFQECWNDRPRDYLIIIGDESTNLFRWNRRDRAFKEVKLDGEQNPNPKTYVCKRREEF